MNAIPPLPRLRAKAPASLSRMMLAVGFVHAQSVEEVPFWS